MPRPRPLLRLLPALLLPLLVPSTSFADRSLLDRAHDALHHYELDGGGTLELLAELNAFVAAGDHEPAVAHEAEFLRAVVASDLWLLAEQSSQREAVQRAVGGASAEETEAVIVGRLRDAAAGIYASVAEDSLRALEVQSGPLRAPMGSRSAYAFVSRVAEAVREDGAAALSALAGTLCDDCDTSPFDAPSATAMRIMDVAFESVARIAAVPDDADPFVEAIAPRVAAAEAVLRAVSLRPQPRLDALSLAITETQSAPSSADGLVLIERARLCTGAFSVVRYDTGTSVAHPAVQGAAVLPAVDCVALPDSYRPFPGPLEEVVAHLARYRGAAMAVGGTGAEGHVLTRVLMSAMRAEVPVASLVGRTPAGMLAAIPLRTVRGDDRSAIQVYVRLGGHSVLIRGAGTRTIPRLRTEEGFAFDYEGLRSVARRSRTTSLRYMHSVPLDELVTTAFAVAPETHLTLVLP
ncbi:MAG: hypothetical protein AAF938_21930 [Myxococcota bacterium]